MPYINQSERDEFEELLYDLSFKVGRSPGRLNYMITSVCLARLPLAPKYEDYNEIIGVLECVKQEFYRRAVSKYEDSKMAENGDVYA